MASQAFVDEMERKAEEHRLTQLRAIEDYIQEIRGLAKFVHCVVETLSTNLATGLATVRSLEYKYTDDARAAVATWSLPCNSSPAPKGKPLPEHSVKLVHTKFTTKIEHTRIEYRPDVAYMAAHSEKSTCTFYMPPADDVVHALRRFMM